MRTGRRSRRPGPGGPPHRDRAVTSPRGSEFVFPADCPIDSCSTPENCFAYWTNDPSTKVGRPPDDPAQKENKMNIGKLPAVARRRSIGQLLRVVLLIGVTSALFAQTGRGNIEGTVRDPNGANVPSAKVQVVNIETNSEFDFSSNDLGYYLAPNLPVGSYRITVHKDGFRTTVREPILISSQGDLAVDFKLQIGAVNENVTVTGEAPLLDISATANPSNLTAKFIDDLPLLNFAEKGNITDNLRFLPGNTSSHGALRSGEPAESWSGRVNSAIQGSTEVFVDGAPSSEFSTRRGAILENGPTVEAVAEYTVVANAFNAEYGGFGSWFTTVTMKSGTNQVHGQINDYFGNDALNARNK